MIDVDNIFPKLLNAVFIVGYIVSYMPTLQYVLKSRRDLNKKEHHPAEFRYINIYLFTQLAGMGSSKRGLWVSPD